MNATSKPMDGKKGLIMGVANERSIAWGIAARLAKEGADVAFCYQSEMLEGRVRSLAESVGGKTLGACDAADENQLATLAKAVAKWGKLDFVLHAIAWADKNELRGRYIDTRKANFLRSLEVSCYSFTSLARHLSPFLNPGAALLTMSYYGAERVVPHYNVMGVAKAALEASVRYLAEDLGKEGVRVNALSAGPIKTLAASAIGDFRYILRWNEANAPLRRNVTMEDIAGAGYYLLSPLSAGVSGEVHHVDCGYHVVGMKAVDAPDITKPADDKPGGHE